MIVFLPSCARHTITPNNARGSLVLLALHTPIEPIFEPKPAENRSFSVSFLPQCSLQGRYAQASDPATATMTTM
jgi:hypothetical protein